MCCYWNKGVSFEDDICAMEEPLPAKTVNDPVLLWADRKLVRTGKTCPLQQQAQGQAGTPHPGHDATEHMADSEVFVYICDGTAKDKYYKTDPLMVTYHWCWKQKF